MKNEKEAEKPVTWKQLGNILSATCGVLLILLWIGLFLSLPKFEERVIAFVAIPSVVIWVVAMTYRPTRGY